MVTQSEIAKKVGLDVSSVNKILNAKKGPVFRKETVREVLKLARELGYPFERLKHYHRRKHDRKVVSIPVAVEILRQDGSLVEQGEGILEDLSKEGARISKVNLDKGLFPVDGSIAISALGKHSALPSPRRGQLVRFAPQNGLPGFSIRFQSR